MQITHISIVKFTLILFAGIAFSGNAQSAGEMAVFHSNALAQKMAAKTDNWSDYNLDSAPYPAFSFSYPSTWRFNGYSVFTTSAGVKVAEFGPGVVKLKSGQHCDESTEVEEGIKFSNRPIQFGKLQGRKYVSEYFDDFSQHVWHHYGYCLIDGQYAFVMFFLSQNPDSKTEKTFDKIMSTFRFLEPTSN
jgi:hypothetical protein